jgi:hypothetical protein
MFGRRRNSSKRAGNHSSRSLRFESLEARRMLTDYTVTGVTDNGSVAVVGSLSWAIDQVNTHPGGSHVIKFVITGPNSDITISGVLPPITHALTTINGIDGATGQRTHILKDPNVGSIYNVLTYNGGAEGAGKLTVRDLEISGFQASAILIQSLGDDDQVEIENTVLHGNGSAGISSFDIATGSDGWISIHDNWIYGNDGDAISIVSPVATIPSTSAIRNSITGNTIGRTPGGTASGNGGHGITLGQNAARFDVTNNAIENVTASGRDAVRLLGTAGTQNKISLNSFRNINGSGLLIDLNDDGVSQNDGGDSDSDANNTLNKPVFHPELVTLDGGLWTIPFDVEFDLGGDYRFEFYRFNVSTSQWTEVTSPTLFVSSGQQQLTPTFAASVFNAGDVIAAIAIGDSGTNANNTSEFSEPIYVSTDAPTFLVTQAQDQVNGNNSFFDLSLREALSLAADTDSIGIAPWVGQINLVGLLPTISNEISIRELGSTLSAINANQAARVFLVNNSLTLRYLLLTGASEEAVYATGGDLIVEQVEIAGNGGGIYYDSGGALTVSASTIADNSGRGVFVAANDAILTNSTIANNTTEDNGAGVYVGYRAPGYEVTLVNMTITENHAYTSTSAGSLPDDHAGGIYVEADMDVLMYNSIVAYNFAGSGSGINSDLGVEEAIPYSGHIEGSNNLLGVIGISYYYGGAIVIGSNDPLLSQLGNYGGPTRTCVLLQNSAAIDAGDNAVALSYGLDEDQRGADRPIDFPGVGRPGAKIDIGAVELAVGEIYS